MQIVPSKFQIAIFLGNKKLEFVLSVLFFEFLKLFTNKKNPSSREIKQILRE